MTSGYWILILLVVLVGGIILWDCRRSRRLFCVPLPRPFRGRESQATAWRNIGDKALLENSDAVLSMLCEAFSFNPDDRYQFAPYDRIIDVYRACYSRWTFWRIADSIEIETLMMDLSRRFHFDEEELSELALGEIVGLIQPSSPTDQSPQ
jgi:hypothetical protein